MLQSIWHWTRKKPCGSGHRKDCNSWVGVEQDDYRKSKKKLYHHLQTERASQKKTLTRQRADVWGVSMCAFYVFPWGWAQLGVIFCVPLLLLQRKSHMSKCKTNVMLEMFPDRSIAIRIDGCFKNKCYTELSVKYKAIIALKYYGRIKKTEGGGFV